MAEFSHSGAFALQKTTVPGCTVFPLAMTRALSVTGLSTLIEAEGKRVNVVDVGVFAFAAEASDRLRISTAPKEWRRTNKSRHESIVISWHAKLDHLLTKDKRW